MHQGGKTARGVKHRLSAGSPPSRQSTCRPNEIGPGGLPSTPVRGARSDIQGPGFGMARQACGTRFMRPAAARHCRRIARSRSVMYCAVCWCA
eukprot:4264501-Alexandrium_andersonii.AAC.1